MTGGFPHSEISGSQDIHGAGSLSVSQEYLALEDGPPIFRQGFTCLALLDIIIYPIVTGAITLYRSYFQMIPLHCYQLKGWPPFARRY